MHAFSLKVFAEIATNRGVTRDMCQRYVAHQVYSRNARHTDPEPDSLTLAPLALQIVAGQPYAEDMASRPRPRFPTCYSPAIAGAFSVGTLGRDMVYALVSLYLIVFLTEVLNASDTFTWWAGWLILAARLLDAVMRYRDGLDVDNTRRASGATTSRGSLAARSPRLSAPCCCSPTSACLDDAYVVVFALLYLLWGLTWTMNDIPYWALLPALTLNQKQRERIGALAKIFATIGLFSDVVAIIPVTKALGDGTRAWLLFTAAVVTIMLAGQVVTLVGVREPALAVEQPKVTLRGLWRAVVGNDHLLWTWIAMVLFMTGYITTTSFGVYFFKYAYRDESMYTPFGAVLGVAQLAGFLVFPLFRRRFSRQTLCTGATASNRGLLRVVLLRPDEHDLDRRGRIDAVRRPPLRGVVDARVHHRLHRVRALEARQPQRGLHLRAATVHQQGWRGARHKRSSASW